MDRNDPVRRHCFASGPRPELNLEDLYYWDGQTNPLSTLEGLMCYRVYRSHGIAGLRQMMERKTVRDVLEQDLGMGTETSLNDAYRKLLLD